ncbi:MAG TPA: DUF5134 domain-containing protein [Mycobacteriales bacterium]|jgi:hypothetical protein|nr:DUF5134 domain-containing protein [Mycobacteriales bacterium]
MITPSWLGNGLAVVMLAIAAYCASRLVVARFARRQTHYSFDLMHTAMGVAMAGMLTSHLGPTAPWIVVFIAAATWFGVSATGNLLAVRGTTIATGSYLRHLLTSGAMVYMLVATPTVAAAAATPTMMSGPAGSTRFPTLALLLGVFMVGYAVMVTDRWSGAKADIDRNGNDAGRDAAPILAPGAVACCQVAMNITMGYMLVVLL